MKDVRTKGFSMRAHIYYGSVCLTRSAIGALYVMGDLWMQMCVLILCMSLQHVHLLSA